MKHFIQHTRAKLRGRKGLKAHAAIIGNIFVTRDALREAAENMTAEIQSNTLRQYELQERSFQLQQNRREARVFADRLHDLFR